MLYHENPVDTFTAWSGEPINEVRHPRSIEQAWSEEELNAIGLFRPAAADPIPEGKVSVGKSVQRVDGVVKFVLTLADAPAPTAEEVTAERDRRIAAGFTFMGHLFQADPESLQNVNGAVSAALAAQLGGIAPDEANWFNGGAFSWLAADNTSVQMTPGDVVAFGMAAAAHKNAHIHAARTLKNTDPIPADFADDRHWP